MPARIRNICLIHSHLGPALTRLLGGEPASEDGAPRDDEAGAHPGDSPRQAASNPQTQRPHGED